ncbi:hypothetical protein M8G38_12825 [Providencia stuartii]|uniref:hypothetical protein n=1 Tax=Providencia stuartii TaxID=588 RepID=UPI00201D451C|nr:hypothetical protein [Providencia stuartii]UQZ10682.1 hypothetical protein M8G38_12825 [Providencia stuartii]
MKLKAITLALSLTPLISLADAMTFVCGQEFIQVFDNNGLIDEVRVNNKPTKIVIASHKVNENGNVDTYLMYGFKGNQTVTQLFNSGDTHRTTAQKFIFQMNGSPEKPGEPVTQPILCK